MADLSDAALKAVPTPPSHAHRDDEALSGAHGGAPLKAQKGTVMNTIIYIVGLVVIIGAVLSYFGFR